VALFQSASAAPARPGPLNAQVPKLRTFGSYNGIGEQQQLAEHLAPGPPFGQRLIGPRRQVERQRQ